MLLSKPIKTRRTPASEAGGVRLVVFPGGIKAITPAQKAALRRAAKTVNLTRGSAETRDADGEPPIVKN